MAKKGRRQKNFIDPETGLPVVGLARLTDGRRWKNLHTGERWTEADPRLAVKRYREWEVANTPTRPTVALPVGESDVHLIGPLVARAARQKVTIGVPLHWKQPGRVETHVDAEAFYHRVRHELLTMPGVLAQRTGIPELLNWRTTALPKPSLTLREIIATYEQQNPATSQAKRRALTVFRQMATHAKATTLDELTQNRLIAWRQTIETSATIKSAGTKTWTYGAVKGVLGFAAKAGLESAQISAAIERCKVLWTTDALPPVQPKPISRDDFHRLLTAAGNSQWRAWLLAGLNFAMYLQELRLIRWAELDLEAKTFCTIRNKTKAKRIPRAAVLWDETVDAFKTFRKGPMYVFTSQNGTAYASSAARANKFRQLCNRAGVGREVSFASLRDATFTHAIRGADQNLAKVLCGHAAAGHTDAYVLRDPAMVAPACEAVYKAFAPFPMEDQQ